MILQCCHPEEGFSPTKDLRLAHGEATAGEPQAPRLRGYAAPLGMTISTLNKR